MEMGPNKRIFKLDIKEELTLITETYETTFSWANYSDEQTVVQAEGKIGDYYFYEISVVAGDPQKPEWIQTRFILARDAKEAKAPFDKMLQDHIMKVTIEAERARINIPQTVREALNKGG